jgi:response regulator of citrate/malate metabolism
MYSYGILYENNVLENQLIDYLDRITFLNRDWSCSFDEVENHILKNPVSLLFISVESPPKDKIVLLEKLAFSNNTIVISNPEVLPNFEKVLPNSIIDYIVRPLNFELVVNAVMKYSSKYDTEL